MQKSLILSLMAMVTLSANLMAEDVQGFRGENRQGKYNESNLLKSWPQDGLKPIWTYDSLGTGWGVPTKIDDKLYLVSIDPTDKNAEMLTCLDLQGKKVWETRTGAAWTKNYPGGRSAPSYVKGAKKGEGHFFLFTSLGEAVCVAEKDGKVVWKTEIKDAYEGRTGVWGYSESVIVGDGKVVVTPAGAKAQMVALDQQTGKVAWTTPTLGDNCAYVSPVLMGNNVIQVTAKYIFSVDIQTGKMNWKFDFANREGPKQRSNSIHCNPPLIKGNQIFVTSGYDQGAVMLDVNDKNDEVKVLWWNFDLDPHHDGVVEIDGKIYGSNWKNNNAGNWACVDWTTGKTIYDTPWGNLGKGSIVTADGLLYCYEEKRGTIALVKPSDKFDVVSQFAFTLGKREHWGHLVIADGVLYVRRGETVAAYDIKAK